MPRSSLQWLIGEGIAVSTFPSADEEQSIADGATGQLVAFLGTDGDSEISEVVERAFAPVNTTQALAQVPDTWEDFDIGREHLAQLTSQKWNPLDAVRADVDRGSTFVARSFLYLASASQADTALIADRAREPIFEMAAIRHALLCERVLEALSSTASAQPTGHRHWPVVDAPLASIVLPGAAAS